MQAFQLHLHFSALTFPLSLISLYLDKYLEQNMLKHIVGAIQLHQKHLIMHFFMTLTSLLFNLYLAYF